MCRMQTNFMTECRENKYYSTMNEYNMGKTFRNNYKMVNIDAWNTKSSHSVETKNSLFHT